MQYPDQSRKFVICWPSSTFVTTVTTRDCKNTLKSDYIRKIATDACLIGSMPTPTSSKTPPGLIKSIDCVPCTYTTNSGSNDLKLYPYSEYRLCDCAFRLRHSRQRAHVFAPGLRCRTSDRVLPHLAYDDCCAQSFHLPTSQHFGSSKMRLITSHPTQTAISRLEPQESNAHHLLPEFYHRHSHHCRDPQKQNKRQPNSSHTPKQDFMRHSYPSAEYYPHNNFEVVQKKCQQKDVSKPSLILLSDRRRFEDRLAVSQLHNLTRNQLRSQKYSDLPKNLLRKLICSNMSTSSSSSDGRVLEDYVALFKEVQIH